MKGEDCRMLQIGISVQSAEIEARRWLKGGSGFFDHEAVDRDVEGDA